MRIVPPRGNKCFFNRPFAGNTVGAALYASVPGGDEVIYRNARIFPHRGNLVALGAAFPLGGTGVQKTAAIAFGNSPISLTTPTSWHSQTVLLNVRTHECDCENEAINGARSFTFDSSGNIVNPILGTANLIRSQKQDAGGWLFTFTYLPSSDGLQPAQFNLIRTAGPTTPATVSTPYNANSRSFTLTVAGLTNAGNYTFKIQAANGGTTADLITGIAITADSQGPPAVSGLTAIAY